MRYRYKTCEPRQIQQYSLAYFNPAVTLQKWSFERFQFRTDNLLSSKPKKNICSRHLYGNLATFMNFQVFLGQSLFRLFWWCSWSAINMSADISEFVRFLLSSGEVEAWNFHLDGRKGVRFT